MTFGSKVSLASLALIVAVGCGSDPKKPAETAPVETATAPSTPAVTSTNKDDDDGSNGQLNISDEVRKACGISTTDAYFAFDSTNILPQARQLLDKLAACFTTGPLAKRQMRLVGHADPRGDEEYNNVLGGKRADSVKNVLVKSGMAATQIDTTSRGEMDATGTDEAGWARDRRVDVALGN